MARLMTETELLEYFELCRRLAQASQSKGQFEHATRLHEITREIEKHLHKFGEEFDVALDRDRFTDQL